MKRALIAHVLVLIALGSSAQERFGLVHSNFAGIDAVGLNPARMAGQWPYMDIRVFGNDLFVWNNLVGLAGDDQGLVGHLREGVNTGTIGQATMRTSYSTGEKHGFVEANALGPAISVALGRGSVGASVRLRSFTSVTGISPAMAIILVNGLDHPPLLGKRQREEDVYVASLTATEVNLSYAHILYAQQYSVFSAGATVRYQIGHAAAALSLDELDFTVVDSMRMDIHSLTGRYAAAMPEFNGGRGWGGDIGFTYERSLEEVNGSVPHRPSAGCTPRAYRYRLGLSVLDLGGVRFKNATSGTVNGGSTIIADRGDVNVNDVEGLDSLFGTLSQWTSDDGLRLGSPTAVSLQYDQRVADQLYVAMAYVQRLPLGNGTRVRRSNSFAITPRFETRYFEMAVPVVIHEYAPRRPSVGLMLRMGAVTVGSDHLLPIVLRSDTYAADVYFRIKVMLHRSPACKSKGKRGSTHVRGSTDALPCALPN